MSSSPLFSIIIPTRDRPKLLEECLSSVLAQTFPDFEVLIIDDGGRTPLAVPRDHRIRIIRHAQSLGAAAARNRGLTEAHGHYVTFLDDDDVYTPNRLELALVGLKLAPIAFCWRAQLGTGKITWRRQLNGWVKGALLEAPVPQLGSAAIVKELCLLFDSSFSTSEDIEWWLRMSLQGPVASVPEVGYLYRDHDGPRLTGRLKTRLECRLHLLSKHERYFAEHPRAAAYHWKRAGGMAETSGDMELALSAYCKSIKLAPHAKTIAHAARVAALRFLQRG